MRTSPGRNGGGTALWCADLSCSGTWGSAVQCRLLRADVVRNIELWSAPQTRMIEGLTVNRQHFHRKSFRCVSENFGSKAGRAGSRHTPGLRRRQDGTGPGPRANPGPGWRADGQAQLWTGRRKVLTGGPHIPSLWRRNIRELSETFRDCPRPRHACSAVHRGHLTPPPKEALRCGFATPPRST